VAEAYDLRLLGEGVRLYRGDQLLRLDDRAGLLLAFLALAGPTTRERAAGLLWPDSAEPRARANLRQLLLRLRRVADVALDRPLRLSPAVTVDVADALADHAGATGGTSLLFGVDAGFSEPLEEWLDGERGRYADTMRARLVERLAEQRAAGRLDLAVAAARRSLAFEPSSEASYRTLMALQLEQGDAGAVLETFARCREMLGRLYDAHPSRESVDVAERAAAALAEQVRGPLLAPSGHGPFEDPSVLARRAEAGGWLREGAALLRVAARETPESAERGAVLVNLAWLEHQLGDAAAAGVAAEAGVALLRIGGGPRLVDGLFALGSLASHRGDVHEARSRWSEALARLEEGLRSGADDAGRLRLRLNLALVEDALGDPDAARGHYLAALQAAEDGRDDRARATVFNNLAHDRLAAGRARDALSLLRRSLSLALALEDRQLEGHVLDGLAQAELALGGATRARALSARAVELAREIGDGALQVEALTTLAGCWRALGDEATAAAVAAVALRSARDQGYLQGVARSLLELIEAVGPDDARTAPVLGALADDPRVPPAVRARAQRARAGTVPLAAAMTLEDAVAVTLR
jgi:DNA-binding SARP family transcriptional activator